MPGFATSAQMSEPPRVAVVTGVGRRQGIGYAIARRLLADGLNVMIHSWASHDAEQPWSPDPGEQSRVIENSEAFQIGSTTSKATSRTPTHRDG
jgi:NAD(P)-dependent dehydrogenase (short-subunit alcohol dehydrogenase family)